MNEPVASNEAVYDITELRQRLAPYLENNPDSALEARRASARVVRPWGDKSIEFRVVREDHDLIEALNFVRFPSRYSAIWHADSRDLEFIYTIARVPDEVRGRRFLFRFEGKEFACEFGPTSTRLLVLAGAARYPTQGSSDNRNLDEFTFFVQARGEHPERVANLQPTSFWVRSLDWNQDFFSRLVLALNFHMYYYDRSSPIAVIHEAEVGRDFTQTRLTFGEFPDIISARELDPTMLGLWFSSLTASPRLRFLYCYQVIEYGAFYFMRDVMLRGIKKVMLSPEIAARPTDAARKVIDVVESGRISDDEKIRTLLQQLVDPKAIWTEIEANRGSFEKDLKFDGGFTLPALMRVACDADEFCGSVFPKFADQLRHMRNALVHGREARITGAIAPTIANDVRLLPWIGPITTAAMQVMLFQES